MKSLFNFTFYFLVPIAFLGFIFWYGWGDSFQSKGSLVLKNGFLGEMGALSKNTELLSRNFLVENKSKEDVVISRIYTDCDCVSSEVFFAETFIDLYSLPKTENDKPLGLILGPGQSLELKTTIDVRGNKSAIFSRNIFLETKKPKQILKINLRARLID